MARRKIIQNDFLAGETSPRMELQDTLDGRKHAVESMKNWLIHLQGTAETSRGWEWVLDVSGSYGRIFGFPISTFTGFMVVVTETKVYITDPSGFARSDSLVVNGDFEDGGTGWTQTAIGAANIVFSNGVVLLTGGLLPDQIASIRQGVTVVIGHNNSVVIQIASGEGPFTVDIGSAEGLSDIDSVVVLGEEPVTIDGLVSSTTSLWIECIVIGGDLPKALTDIQCYDTDVAPALIEFSSPWGSRSEIGFIQIMMSPDELAMYFVSPGVIPQRLFHDEATQTWSLGPIPFVSPPSTWSAGSYPAAIGFFGGRMYLGGASKDSSLFWGSKSGVFFDFTLGSLADDALEFRLNRRGAIRWMVGGQTLIIGTENSEHIISSEGGVIIPGDIFSLVQSTNGSWPAQALEIGNEVMYISPDGRKIRSIGYQWDRNAWRSRDLTYPSEHITGKGNSLIHLHYSANPDSVIKGHTLIGEAITCTYEPFTNTVGFARRTTQGAIVSMSCLSFAGTDETWVLVRRDESGTLSLEKEHLDHNVKLDSHSHFISETPIDTIQIPRLAGKTCQVLVDGAVHPDVIPSVPEGDVVLEFAGFEIIIGLFIDSVMVTLPVAEYDQAGTTRTMKTKFTEVWVRILDSWRPKINGQRTPNRRVPTPMGEVEPAMTESVRVSDVGWSENAKITIEQDLPLRTEVAGLFGRIDQEEI